MSNSPAARRALADTLKDGGIEVGPIDRVETWEIGKEGEIPDLVCFDDKGEKQVLIEAKFWADLTKNQPNQYLKQLLEDRQDWTCRSSVCRAQGGTRPIVAGTMRASEERVWCNHHI